MVMDNGPLCGPGHPQALLVLLYAQVSQLLPYLGLGWQSWQRVVRAMTTVREGSDAELEAFQIQAAL